MNFTQEIKRELTKSVPQDRRGKLALLCGVLHANGRLGEEGFSFTSESESTAEYLLSLAESLFGAQMTLAEAAYDPKHGRDKLTFALSGDFVRELSYSPEDRNAEEALSYVKGAFLGGGSCTLPRTGTKTGYHLEFEFPAPALAELFREALDVLQFVSGCIERGEHAVVYIKSREAISDFLSVIGAQNALATFDRVSASREENNRENRALNCSSGNADRAAIASVGQVRVISAMKRSGKLETLPAPLREAAEARLEHPELSLGELAARLDLTKSGLSHRLRKIMELSKKE